MDVDRHQPDSGGRLLDGRYRLGGLLGQGGVATVHDAVDVVLGRRVAVKLYRAADPVGRFRFASEARLLAGLSHPGLVAVYDVCLDGDQPFLVLQLVNGPTLRDLMNPGPFDPAAMARIGASLADALAYVHDRDVVHRDVKPSNILIDPSGEPRLTDFGLARVLTATHLTGSGEYVGTAAYLAPEQITDVDVGPPADIYALGLVLLECLTGRTEYTGNAAETALARLSRRPRIPEDLPSAWRILLAAMTAQDPADRPSAARCAGSLSAIAAGRVAALVAEPSISRQRSGAKPARAFRPRPVHAGLAALALAVVATVAATTTDTVPGHPSGQAPSPVPESSRTEPVTSAPPAGLPATRHTKVEVVPPPRPELNATGPQHGPGPAIPDAKQNKTPKNDNKANGKGRGKG